jgi:hypothetical protein
MYTLTASEALLVILLGCSAAVALQQSCWSWIQCLNASLHRLDSDWVESCQTSWQVQNKKGTQSYLNWKGFLIKTVVSLAGAECIAEPSWKPALHLASLHFWQV